jgi:protoporphyrinogen oxidase
VAGGAPPADPAVTPERAASPQRWAIVGGGMLGCTLALRLADAGHDVTLLEAAPALGGLASAWSIDTPEGPVVWDRHYHVTLMSDAQNRSLLEELGLESDLRFVETKTGYLAGGRLSSVSNVAEFLRLPALGLVDKVRLGGTIWYGSKVKRWERLEQQRVADWLARLSGRRVLERFWMPQLRAKLGDAYTDVSAAFMWATIQRLYRARRTGLKKEMFGYLPGGYARILERFAEVLGERGVHVELGHAVSAVRGGAPVEVEDPDGAVERFDQVVVTAAAPIAARMCTSLPEAQRDALAAVRYHGIVCASVVLRQAVAGFYLTYLADETPFTAVVEMTALVDPEQVRGHHLVYLPRYVPSDDPLFEVPDETLRERWLDAFLRLYPHLGADDVVAFRVSRARHVFPLPTLGYSQHEPQIRSGDPGVWTVSSANIVNGTLNVDETVTLANRVAPLLLTGAAAPTRRPA